VNIRGKATVHQFCVISMLLFSFPLTLTTHSCCVCRDNVCYVSHPETLNSAVADHNLTSFNSQTLVSSNVVTHPIVYIPSSRQEQGSYGLDDRGSIPDRNFFLFATASIPALGPTVSPQSVPGVVRPGRD